MSNGFWFLCVSTGIIACITFVCLCVATSNRREYAGFLAWLEIILVLTFLITGFLGFAYS